MDVALVIWVPPLVAVNKPLKVYPALVGVAKEMSFLVHFAYNVAFALYFCWFYKYLQMNYKIKIKC